MRLAVRRFRACGGWWTIDKNTQPDADHRNAFASFENQCINFGSLSNAQKAPESLIHELLHVADEQTQIGLTHDQVTILSFALTDYLHQLGLYPEELEID